MGAKLWCEADASEVGRAEEEERVEISETFGRMGLLADDAMLYDIRPGEIRSAEPLIDRKPKE